MLSTANILSTSCAHISKVYQQKPFLEVKLNVVFISLPHVFDDLHVTDNHMKLMITVLDYPIMTKCPQWLSWTQFVFLKIVKTNISAPTATTTTNTILLVLHGSKTYSLIDKDKVFPSRALKTCKKCGITASSILIRDTRRSWVVNFTLRLLYLWGKILSYCWLGG